MKPATRPISPVKVVEHFHLEVNLIITHKNVPLLIVQVDFGALPHAESFLARPILGFLPFSLFP